MNDNNVLDAIWAPESDADLIKRHEELRKKRERMSRSNVDLWDYRNPRTAGEYILNTQRRRDKMECRVAAWVNRLFIGSIVFWGVTCVLALLVG